ncbi:MAG: PorT family protein [Chitinophagaceae bacterium]|nr:PorT family protein [Chitinophagaceae bacterium]
MRKIFFVLLLVVTLPGFAQRNKVDGEHENFFRFGIKAGANINKITGKSYKDGFNFNFQAGAFLQFNFSSRFGLQPEVNFVQTSAEFSNDVNDIYNDLFRSGSQKKSKLNFLEVPVLLNINVGSSKRVKLQIGPAYGGLLKQTVDSLKNNGDIYKNGEWAVIGGLWIQIPFVNLGARYKLGLTDLNSIDNRQTWKSQAIQVFVGVTF